MSQVLMNSGEKPGIVVVVDDRQQATAARLRNLAEHLHLPWVSDTGEINSGLVLTYGPRGLELQDRRANRLRPLTIDFSSRVYRIHGSGLLRKQPLARALGRKNRTVIDVTAGLGQDAFLSAAIGYKVIAIERSPLLAALLKDAVHRMLCDAETVRWLKGCLVIQEGDARQLIPTQAPADVIYLDPMFPPKRRKSALPKRELRLLRELVGDDEDAGELFTLARAHARNRVVVKRPHYAEVLAPNPNIVHTGKLVRYDVYLS